MNALLLFAALIGCYAVTTSAQTYPAKAVRIVVPFAAGGGTDIIARIMAQKLSDDWGRNVVVDNRPGGGTVIGSELVARSTPDGYTLLLTANPHSSNPALVAKLPYDTVRDFAAVTMTASAPLLLVVHPTLPAHTVQELIAHARARSTPLAYATSGNGGPQHLSGELFKYLTWYGVFAPGATARPLIARIQEGMARALASPEVKERLARDGVQAVGNKPDEFAAFVKREIEIVTKLIRMAGIKPD